MLMNFSKLFVLSFLFSTAYANNEVSTTVANNFTVDANTVIDNKTKLMWKRCSEGQTPTYKNECLGDAARYKWHEALMLANSLNGNSVFAGYADWRVPNVNELLSIVDYESTKPRLNPVVFPNSPTRKGTYWSSYWSSSPAVHYGNGHSYVLQLDTGTSQISRQNEYHHIRLVRNIE